ncbi:aromatic-ring hydroxylase C-terminal domain-containing protein [Nocardiopsis chromatogenes]|uniref:aromatic-ring hydroxylase C-terminal domain-containing protein n=1 Tax=Nocardiopsis chromatogenes TaxID=280239 RepID=UPI0009FCA65E
MGPYRRVRAVRRGRRGADDRGGVPDQRREGARSRPADGRGAAAVAFTFQARQAESYRDGRVLLAEDAAHLFPATGIALNAGMLDAVNLGWKPTAAVQGWAPEGLLDTYGGERHAAAERTLLHTRAQVALRRGLNPVADASRELFQELVADESAKRRMAALLAGADVRHPDPAPGAHPLTGTFVEDLAVETEVGTTSVAELMREGRPLLLVPSDRPELREAAEGWKDRVEVCGETTDGRPADALLIRPDCHIAWAAGVDEPAETSVPGLRRSLEAWFGPGPEAAAPTTTGRV